MAVHVSNLIYVAIADDVEDWINNYLDAKNLGHECIDDMHLILIQAIERQFSHPDAVDDMRLKSHIFGMASVLLDVSCYVESAAMSHFFEDHGDCRLSQSGDVEDALKITGHVIGMLRTLSDRHAEDAKIQERITLHNTWYYILGLSFASWKSKPYPLPTLGQAKKLAILVDTCWSGVSERFPQLFVNRKKPEFEAESPIVSRQMRAGYKAGLSLQLNK